MIWCDMILQMIDILFNLCLIYSHFTQVMQLQRIRSREEGHRAGVRRAQLLISWNLPGHRWSSGWKVNFHRRNKRESFILQFTSSLSSIISTSIYPSLHPFNHLYLLPYYWRLDEFHFSQASSYPFHFFFNFIHYQSIFPPFNSPLISSSWMKYEDVKSPNCPIFMHRIFLITSDRNRKDEMR